MECRFESDRLHQLCIGVSLILGPESAIRCCAKSTLARTVFLEAPGPYSYRSTRHGLKMVMLAPGERRRDMGIGMEDATSHPACETVAESRKVRLTAMIEGCA